MGFGVLNAAMLVGLLGAAVPVVIHWISRTRDPVVDWGAMQFLDIGRRARSRLRLTEWLLMLARMGLLAVVALALARPFRGSGAGGAGTAGADLRDGPARDVVLILDGSSAMDRSVGGASAKARAIAWARPFVNTLGAGDTVAVLVAGDRVRPKVDPPSFDKAKVADALKAIGDAPARGSGDIPTALAAAFRVLERTQNPAREVIILSDGRRAPWRAGEPGRWGLVRDLHQRLPIPPRVWSIAFGPTGTVDPAEVLPNGSVGPVRVSRGLVTPEMPLTVSADLTNAGPGPLSGSAELAVDGRAVNGSSRTFGPIAEGGSTPLEFTTTLSTVGSHLVTVRINGTEDALPSDDESSAAVEVAHALGVLLVNGEPSREPFGGETDFLRAALAPQGDETPRAKATVVTLDGLSAQSLLGQGVLILANVERLSLDQKAAVEAFVFGGGGLLVAPGDQTDAVELNGLPWPPAKLGDLTGDFALKKVVAHPSPSSFSGASLGPLGKGETPALAGAGLFAYRRLEPVPGASVPARLDTGEPWAVERSYGRGRVLLLAGPLDAEGGTLPVNPDFVPLVHEWVFALAAGIETRAVKPGEPLVFALDPAPSADVRSLPILTPGGDEAFAVVTRAAGLARARYDDTVEPGVYRLTLPGPPGTFSYATVASDGGGSDPAPLEPAEAARLSEGWPLAFEPDPAKLPSRIAASVGAGGGRRELWRGLVLVALVGLCVEIYLTRRLVRGHGGSPTI